MKALHLALLLVVLLTEGWMLNDVWNGQSLEWESTISFISALIALIFAEPVVHKIYPPAQLAPTPQIAQADVDLFAEFQKALPHDPTILTIQNQDFGASFRTSYIEPLHHFVATWTDVHKEFVDQEIETAKKKVYEAASKLVMALSQHTVTEGKDGSFTTVFPEYLRGEARPEHVLESARVLNSLGRAFMPMYESFVRLAKAKLALPKS